MCGSAVGTGGGPADADGGVDAGTGEAGTDDDGGGSDELIGGSELPTSADNEVTGALGTELADVDVHAVSPSPAAMTTAAARHPVRFTHPVCRLG
jgi:hypothetical protein